MVCAYGVFVSDALAAPPVTSGWRRGAGQRVGKGLAGSRQGGREATGRCRTAGVGAGGGGGGGGGGWAKAKTGRGMEGGGDTTTTELTQRARMPALSLWVPCSQ